MTTAAIRRGKEIEPSKDQTIEDLKQQLAQLQVRVDSLERVTLAALARNEPGVDDKGMMKKLARLTLRQHATFTATMAGLSYSEIATLMKVDVTTVKLHLRSVRRHLDAESRNELLIEYRKAFDAIPPAVYKEKFGLAKDWYLNPAKAPKELTIKKSVLAQ